MIRVVAAAKGTGPPVDELYARTNESETTAISEPSKADCTECDTSEPARAVFQGASEDGSRVFFLSEQKLLGGASGMNLYEYDFQGAKEGKGIVLVSPDAKGVARVAENGSRVYFVSEGVLTPQANEYGVSAREGEANLYVYDTEDNQTAFIGTLAAGDAFDWSQEDDRSVDATPDGRVLLFTSSADLTPGDTSSVEQVFEYDAQEQTLVRVSAGQNGYNDDGNTDSYPAHFIFPQYFGKQEPAPQLGSLSEDGQLAVFESSDALTPQALVGYPNVYEYRAGEISLISDGQDRAPGGTRLLGMDPSGGDVFFQSADQLVPQDGDTQVDVYDARVDGGFASPAPPSCEGEGCQGALAATPLFGSIASAAQPAGENTPVASSEPPAVKRKPKAKAHKAKARGRARKGKPRSVRRRALAGVRGHRHGMGSRERGRA